MMKYVLSAATTLAVLITMSILRTEEVIIVGITILYVVTIGLAILENFSKSK